ncbi:MAG: hypothetical protein KGZ37_06300 [Nitrosarchaeum sp.]|nr:hypothetical protein [Nitrosarchaeum sp.]
MENKKEELTYILGAGASFESIPVVRTFLSRFQEFCKFLKNIAENNNYGFNLEERERLKHAWSVVLNFSETLKTYQSFDTYFKKLFHIEDLDSIKLTKKIIHLFFLWEHTNSADKKPEDESKFWKQSLVDRRYDAFVAGLLKPFKGKTEMFSKTNFITWNYDINLLVSIKNYFDPKTNFKNYFEKIKLKIENENIWEINNQVTIINMNGFFYSQLFDEFNEFPRNISHQLMLKKIVPNYFQNNFQDLDSDKISFAWESDDDKTAQAAAAKISSSKNIIVIGYTFPLYNRLLDYKYFNNEIISQRKLYLQDPNVDNIAIDLKDNFKINLDSNLVTRIYNCDSFFVPSDIIDPHKFQTGNYYFC